MFLLPHSSGVRSGPGARSVVESGSPQPWVAHLRGALKSYLCKLSTTWSLFKNIYIFPDCTEWLQCFLPFYLYF